MGRRFLLGSLIGAARVSMALVEKTSLRMWVSCGAGVRSGARVAVGQRGALKLVAN